MKTAELTGVLLDYWTARADGKTTKILKPGDKINSMRVKEEMCAVLTPGYADWWQPFHVYAGSCGEIIDREHITVAWQPMKGEWMAGLVETEGGSMLDFHWLGFDEIRLVAAMRAFVASKFGAELPNEVPACY